MGSKPPDRIRVRRNPKKGRYERATVETILDRALVQGLVLARSAFEHSANYEPVVAFGRFEPIEDESERSAALAAFTNKILPGRFEEVRRPSAKELKATTVLAIPIEQASAEVRYGGPDDDDSDDAALDVWGGEIPIVTSFGEPVASPGLRTGIAVPASVDALSRGAAGPCEDRAGCRSVISTPSGGEVASWQTRR